MIGLLSAAVGASALALASGGLGRAHLGAASERHWPLVWGPALMRFGAGNPGPAEAGTPNGGVEMRRVGSVVAGGAIGRGGQKRGVAGTRGLAAGETPAAGRRDACPTRNDDRHFRSPGPVGDCQRAAAGVAFT